MSFTGGYQSDIRLQATALEGTIPLENLPGTYGTATGLNDYTLHLDPAPTSYYDGMDLYVVFEEENEDAVRLDVNELGFIPVKKLLGTRLEELDPGELKAAFVHLLIYKEDEFILANQHIEPVLPRQGLRTLHKDLQTVSAAAGITEQDIGTAYSLPPGTLLDNESLDIRIDGGLVTESPKTMRVRMGTAILFFHTVNATAPFSIEISGSRLDADTFKGQALMLMDGEAPVVIPIEVTGLNMDGIAQAIRFTAQGESPTPDGQVSRFGFSVRQLI